MPWHQTQSDLFSNLDEQLSMLRGSCDHNDAGQTYEAKRLATVVDTLVHDRSKRTVSLLTRLGIKSQIKFISKSTGWSDTSLTTQMPLVSLKRSAGGARYAPLLDGFPQDVSHRPFTTWWEEPVLRDKMRRLITRKNLVCSLRDQDGGSHIDGVLDNEAYVSVSRKNGASWFFGKDGDAWPIEPGPHLATMRQIAWEVDKSISLFQMQRKEST